MTNLRRVFIDGTQKCSGHQHNFLVAVAVLLCIVLVLFCAGLKFRQDFRPHASSCVFCVHRLQILLDCGAACLSFCSDSDFRNCL